MKNAIKIKNEFSDLWGQLESILITTISTFKVFNQYRDHNNNFDLPNAPDIRRGNLRAYLEQASKNATILVVGEAAGPWGCRFSGVPFTGEKQLLDPSFPYRGTRSSLNVTLVPTRANPPFISRSAEAFWEVMLQYHRQFVVWDAFPLHSHKPGDVLTVRNPTKKEVSQFGEALNFIKAFLKPTCIIAVGRKAFEELETLGETEVNYVRHPSRGGKVEFASGIQRLFKNRE